MADAESRRFAEEMCVDHPVGNGVGGSPIVCGDLLIVSHEQDKGSPGVSSAWFAFDRRTGQLRWRREHAETMAASYSTPCMRPDRQGRTQLVFTSYLYGVDGKLYGMTVDGDVVVLRAGLQYEPLAVNPLGEKSHATPAVAGGRMYLRTFSHLICVGGGLR